MKRSEFIKKSVLASVTAFTIPSILKAEKPLKTSTYDKLLEQVGLSSVVGTTQHEHYCCTIIFFNKPILISY